MTERKFNPFDAIPILDGLAEVRTRRLLVVVPIMFLLPLGATLIDGTTGGLEDIRVLSDMRLVFGADGIGSPAVFPLLRDFPSLWLFAAIVLTFLIVHRQWRLMAVCVRDLERNGAISPRENPHPGKLLAWGERRFPGQGDDSDALEMVMRQARDYVTFISVKLSWILALLAVFGAVLVMFGEYHALFEVVAPDGLAAAQRETWLTQAYESWWASIEHPIGAFAYLALGAFALFIVIMQNVIGLACSYFVLTLPKVARIDADWLNRDGLYGWRPIAMVFRTVYWSLTLHGATLAVILIALGPTHVLWIAPLLMIWVLVAPIYIGGSFLIFRRVERIARARRFARIESEMEDAQLTASSSPVVLMPFLLELDRTAEARIKPLRLGRWSWSFMLISFVVPLVIGVAQLITSA